MPETSDAGPRPKTVIDFWMQAGPDRWFKQDDEFDRAMTERFGAAADAAAAGRHDDWSQTPEGALALILLLDQFRRNIHRGTPDAFSADPKALGIAEAAIERRFDRALPIDRRVWFYLPLEHAEDLDAQERCLELTKTLCVELGEDDYLDYAIIHRDVIARFGRFPHRNAILGRPSTPEEVAFLEGGGFSA